VSDKLASESNDQENAPCRRQETRSRGKSDITATIREADLCGVSSGTEPSNTTKTSALKSTHTRETRNNKNHAGCRSLMIPKSDNNSPSSGETY